MRKGRVLLGRREREREGIEAWREEGDREGGEGKGIARKERKREGGKRLIERKGREEYG